MGLMGGMTGRADGSLRLGVKPLGFRWAGMPVMGRDKAAPASDGGRGRGARTGSETGSAPSTMDASKSSGTLRLRPPGGDEVGITDDRLGMDWAEVIFAAIERTFVRCAAASTLGRRGESGI